MKTILSVSRYHYLKRVGIFLIVIALVAGIAGCTDGGVGPYDLTMAADPAIGGTATDETSGSPYEEGAAVSIKAVAAAGYQFAGWMAAAGEFADASAEETTFTMPAQDVTVTANFEPTPLDHFRSYWFSPDMPQVWPYVGEVVDLEDQFGSITATVGSALNFFNPVEKVHDGATTLISNVEGHFMAYGLEYEDEPQWWRVTVNNQFGTQELIVAGPIGLFVPTQKIEPGGHEPPEGLNCFLGYEVIDPPSVEVRVDLSDQFGDEQNVLVTQAKGFANPVRITHDGEVTEIVNPDAHLVYYWTLDEGVSMEKHEVVVSNQFGEYTLNVTQKEDSTLVVPSEKISWEPVEPPLNHFRCYNAGGGTMPYVGEVVDLEDQFGAVTAKVGWGSTLCNPVVKMTQELAACEWVPISDQDHHLMLYILEDVDETQTWRVTVNNQFGEQELTVSGPGGLAVPTQKEGHDPPVGLDHFLIYEVIGGSPVEVVVDLYDQFGYGNNVLVMEPWILASPVRKTHDGQVTNIVNPDEHLVFYRVWDEGAILETHEEVVVTNQFGEHHLNVFQGDEALLGVPSEKVNWYLL